MNNLNRKQQLEIVSLLDSLVSNVRNAMEHINEGNCYCSVCIDIQKAEKIIEEIKFTGEESDT